MSCPVEKNGVPSVIAWSLDGTQEYTAPEGFTEVCTTANKCTAVAAPLEVGETPVRLLP